MRFEEHSGNHLDIWRHLEDQNNEKLVHGETPTHKLGRRGESFLKETFEYMCYQRTKGEASFMRFEMSQDVSLSQQSDQTFDVTFLTEIHDILSK